MDIVKKNLVSIICGAVVLIAVILQFWPISGWFGELQTKASARVGVYNQLRDLLNKERHKPVVALAADAPQEKLEVFPTPAVIERGTQIKAKIEEEAKAIQQAAVNLNRGDKKLLIPDSLPQPANRSVALKFQQEYTKAMDYSSPDPGARAQSIPVKMLRAGQAPTQAEIDAEKTRVKNVIERNKLQADPKTGKPLNMPEVQAEVFEQQQRVPDILYSDAATRCAVYVEPLSLDVMDIRPGAQPPPLMIFWAQMSLWLQQDVWNAIAELNANSKNVTESPVKRIMKITIPREFASPAAPKASAAEGEAMTEAPAATDPTQPIQKNYVISPTGRYSNPLYDVILFKLQLIVEADKVPQVLQALSNNRFITVNETDVTGVDSGTAQAAGYLYGAKPLVQLDLACEALFMRDWTKQYMPKQLRTKLGVAEEQPQPTAG